MTFVGLKKILSTALQGENVSFCGYYTKNSCNGFFCPSESLRISSDAEISIDRYIE
jgi:hypothetical protein